MLHILFFCLILCYLIGSVPTGYWFTKYLFGLDITQHGSGNIGASNVARTLGKTYFIPIFVFDAFKAYAALWFCMSLLAFEPVMLSINFWYLYSLTGALLLGNAYSIFLGFKGGKGVATVLGMLAFLMPGPLVGLFMLSWLLLVALTKRPFIASLSSIFLIVLLTFALFNGVHGAWLLSVVAWLLLRHAQNLWSYVA